MTKTVDLPGRYGWRESQILPSEFFEVAAPGGIAGFKVWTGSAWVMKPVKVWNGSAWVTKPLKRWSGSAWL